MLNSLRLRIADRDKRETLRANGSVGFTDSVSLAWEIAGTTVTQLVAEGLLDRDEVVELLKTYRDRISSPTSSAECLLTHLFSEEERVYRAVQLLNKSTLLQIWEFAHRIPPPEAFYRTNAEIYEACERCAVVVLEASAAGTITTGSLNPLAGEFFMGWLEGKLGSQGSEARRRFLFHVAIPLRHWNSIIRTHFSKSHGV
jgi:hypothetical protein